MSNLVDASLGAWDISDDLGGWTPMISPGWAILNIQVLWQGPTRVFSNRQQAGGVGRKGYPGLEDETRLSVRFHILGQYDMDGTPYANPKIGLQENYDFLEETVWASVDPLRTSRLTRPNGEVRYADIQFDPFPLPDLTGLSDVTGTLGIILPSGAHYPVAS